jgi:hypothetical protein
LRPKKSASSLSGRWPVGPFFRLPHAISSK